MKTKTYLVEFKKQPEITEKELKIKFLIKLNKEEKKIFDTKMLQVNENKLIKDKKDKIYEKIIINKFYIKDYITEAKENIKEDVEILETIEDTKEEKELIKKLLIQLLNDVKKELNSEKIIKEEYEKSFKK